MAARTGSGRQLGWRRIVAECHRASENTAHRNRRMIGPKGRPDWVAFWIVIDAAKRIEEKGH